MADTGGMDGGFSAALMKLIAASGGQIQIGSGFRSTERQGQLFAAAVKKYGSPEKARRYVAPPGHSNHEKGVAADLQFLTPDARRLAHQLAPQFGLIFPMNYEPWHVEPVGARDKASPKAYGLPTDGYLHPQDPNFMQANPQVVAAQLSNALQQGGGAGTKTLLEGGFPDDPGATTAATATTDAAIAEPANQPAGSDTVSRFLASIRKHESSGNYQARNKNPGQTASGAYQFIDKTWNNYGGYKSAYLAPVEVQDAKAREYISGAGNLGPAEWSAIWYIGHVPTSEKEWNTVPHPGAGNKMTPREYANWIANDMAAHGQGTTSGAR